MTRKLLALLAFLWTMPYGFSQCSDRFKEDIFPILDIQRDVVYGANLDSKNNPVSLLMDIYQPQGDTAALRPLMIFVHGGSFVGGSRKDQRIDLIAEYFAHKGYVTANIEYRLQQTTLIDPILDFAEADNWYQAITRAVQDLNAAIRFFKKDAAENNNSFRTDTNTIILYGSSAGAITVLHQAYLKDTTLASKVFRSNIKRLNGLDGNSGNEGYSTNNVKAVVACSGALQDEKFINENTKNIAYLGFHNNPDLTVPFDKGCFITAFCHLGYFFGANRLYKRAETLGMNYGFYKFDEVGHPVDENANPERRKFILETTRDFLADIVCPAIPTAIKAPKTIDLKVYPNPSSGQMKLVLPATSNTSTFQISITDLSGRIVYQQLQTSSNVLEINQSFPSGTYFVKVISEQGEIFTAQSIIL